MVTRLFFSVPVPESIGREIAAGQSKFGVNELSLRWVTPENQHFTLRFLGEVAEEAIERLRLVARQISPKHNLFSLKISGSGFFPEKGEPNVFWIGVGEGRENLIALAEDLSSALKEAGFPPEERPFLPHLTVARIKGKLPERTLQKLAAWREKVFDSCMVTEFFLMESELLPAGPIYRKIEAFPLLAGTH